MVKTMRAAAAAAVFAGLGLTALSVAPATVSAQAATAPLKIAVINSRAILNEAPGRVAAQTVLDREVAAIRAEVQRMSDSLDAMVREYEAREATLSPSARDAQRKAIQDKQGQFELRRDSLGQRADRRQAELMQPILDMVNRVLQEVRDENGYSLILDLAADGHGIVAHDKNLDITDRVLVRVRRQTPPTPASGRGGGGGGGELDRPHPAR